jgi:hypothetical protein
MKRVTFGTRLAITLLAAVAMVGTTEAREPFIVEPTDIPAGEPFCEFPVHVGVVSNREFQEVTFLADGTKLTRITGALVQSFTNVDTGFTIVRNVSGPSLRIDNPDGTGTFTAEGVNWFIFGPSSQANTGQPPLFFTIGLVVFQFTGNIVESFSLAGQQINLCELLAG